MLGIYLIDELFEPDLILIMYSLCDKDLFDKFSEYFPGVRCLSKIVFI